MACMEIGYILNERNGNALCQLKPLKRRSLGSHNNMVYRKSFCSTRQDIDLGVMKLHLEEGFLSGLDGDQICREIRRKLDQKLLLTEEDAMRLMILPLTYPGRERKQKAIEDAIELAESIPDPENSHRILAGMLVFSNQIIAEEQKEKTFRRIKLTWIAQMFEEEKQEALKQNTENVTNSLKKTIAENMLRSGDSVEKVVSCTELSREQVEEIQKNLLLQTAGV